MNQEFAQLNLLDSKSLYDIKPYSVYTTAPHVGYVLDYLGRDELENAEKWPYEHFTYNINTFGFRNPEFDNETDLAAFGCSFTHGTGLADHMLWHNILAKDLNMHVTNFGLPARSIASIVDMFLIVSKHIKIKHAVFLFPSISRLQIAKKHVQHDYISYLNTSADYVSAVNESYELKNDYLYRAIPEEEMHKICRNQVYLLEHMARLRDIKVYISSWEEQTYDFLKKLDLNSAILLAPWRSGSMEFADNDKARDGKHPGPKHHVKWASEIRDSIK
jgi:hypothetical protein